MPTGLKHCPLGLKVPIGLKPISSLGPKMPTGPTGRANVLATPPFASNQATDDGESTNSTSKVFQIRLAYWARTYSSPPERHNIDTRRRIEQSFNWEGEKKRESSGERTGKRKESSGERLRFD
ncbi:hypothetical protein ACLB2K_004536 [Fragaria x ananassa]